MMSPEDLLQRTSAITVPLTKYLQMDKKDVNLVCFFEGHTDVWYYSVVLHSVYQNTYKYIVCGNKDNVLKMYDEIREREGGLEHVCQKAYFIDRDFDDLHNIPSIYETECYSFENYYTNKSAYKHILTEAWGIDSESDAFKTFVELYDTEYQKFHNVLRLFNAYYYIVRQRRTLLNCGHLGNKVDRELATIDIGCCEAKYSLSTLIEKYGISVSDNEIQTAENHLSSMGEFNSFRGKYELEFFIKILRYVLAQLKLPKSSSKRILSTEKKCHCQINEYTFLSDYAQYAVIPQGLIDYINQFKTKSI